MNLYSISFDISTSNVGLALWDQKGKLVELKHVELKIDKNIPEQDRYLNRADIFEEYIKNFKLRVENEYDAIIENIFVEAPLSNTPKNINTTAKLLGFNGIACFILYKIFHKAPKLISVYESRKLTLLDLIKYTKKRNGTIKETLSFPKNVDKKYYIWKKVSKLEPEIKWFYTRNATLKSSSFDMSDAYIVGISGLIILEIISQNQWKERYYNIE